jgi:acid stress chaperone HdeA
MIRSIMAFGAELAVCLLLVNAVMAAEDKKPSEWTCQDFLAVDDSIKPQVVYWMEGYSVAGKPEFAEVDVESFERPITTVITECKKEPKASLWDKIKNHFSNL